MLFCVTYHKDNRTERGCMMDRVDFGRHLDAERVADAAQVFWVALAIAASLGRVDIVGKTDAQLEAAAAAKGVSQALLWQATSTVWRLVREFISLMPDGVEGVRPDFPRWEAPRHD